SPVTYSTYFHVAPLNSPFTSALVGILPFQCSFRKSVRQLTAEFESSGATLMPFTSSGGESPARSAIVAAKSTFRTNRLSVRGAPAWRSGDRMVIGTRMHSSYGHCFGFERCEPHE